MPIRIDNQYLIEHAALHEVLTRYFQGCDRADEAQIRSCFTEDAQILHHGRQMVSGIQAAIDGIFRPSHGKLLAGEAKIRTHFIGNFRVERLEGDVAETETYALAAHVNTTSPEDLVHLMSLRYMDRLRKRSGEWRISERRMTMDWSCRVPAASAMLFVQRVRSL